MGRGVGLVFKGGVGRRDAVKGGERGADMNMNMVRNAWSAILFFQIMR